VTKKEVSPGGSPILHHEPRSAGFNVATPGDGGVEAVEAHFTRVVGSPETVFHELVSDLVHIDVHVIPPAGGRDHWVLFTTGMSDRPMTVPRPALPHYAELMVSLPSAWRVQEPAMKDERWYWPVRWLKLLARFPHEYETWLGMGHTVPNGDPPQPFDVSTKLCGMLLLPPLQLPPQDCTVKAPGKEITILALFPLYAAEMSLKLNKGTDALLDAFDRAGVTEIVDPVRRPAVKSGLFGLWGR
jgi:hypothetical protein